MKETIKEIFMMILLFLLGFLVGINITRDINYNNKKIIELNDSIRYNIIQIDSIEYNIIKKDSIIYEYKKKMVYDVKKVKTYSDTIAISTFYKLVSD